jgi:hypothetical protein
MARREVAVRECRVPTHPLDRRAAIRFHCDFDITCAPFPDGDEVFWSARVRDISLTGIGLLVDRYIEPETVLAVQLQGDESIESYTVLVQVMNTRQEADNQWLLGCAFARSLSNQEVSALL